jgi:glycosyltransferase involved in cell wall biosynthesis
MPTPSLRVAIVVASLRILGGQAVQAQRMLDGWQNDPEIEAWLVPVNPVPRAPFDRLLTVKYMRTLVTQLCYWPLLFRELRRADVVHVFSASYSSFLLAPLPAVIVGRLLGRPVLLNYHSGEAPDHLRRSWIARRVLRKHVDLNVVPSPFLRDVLASFGIPSQVVANTIDVREFTGRVRDPMTARRKGGDGRLARRSGREGGPPRIVSTRNFEPAYNVACVLRAFALVQARYPDASLTLVGSGSEEPALRALASALSLRHVAFAGRVPPGEMHRYYASADVYVQAPSIDNMPLSILEAFASGLPVVSTRVGGVPAMLTDGVQGLLAPDDDAAAVAAQVIRLLEDPEYARRLAAAARETCASYDWRVVRDGWLSAYRTAARGLAPRPAGSQTESAAPAPPAADGPPYGIRRESADPQESA